MIHSFIISVSYRIYSSISRDPKLLSVLIGEVFKTCKLKILGYKPRPYSENSILKQTEMNAKFSKQCFNAVLP